VGKKIVFVLELLYILILGIIIFITYEKMTLSLFLIL
jgi:hypothetical protein